MYYNTTEIYVEKMQTTLTFLKKEQLTALELRFFLLEISTESAKMYRIFQTAKTRTRTGNDDDEALSNYVASFLAHTIGSQLREGLTLPNSFCQL